MGTIYDMKVIKPSDVDPQNSYTLSSDGVTRFCHGLSSFTPLAQFEREFYLYNMVIQVCVCWFAAARPLCYCLLVCCVEQLPFFRKYRHWKMFMEWKSAVRARRMDVHSRRLQSRLFLLDPTLRPALNDLHSLCLNMTSVPMFTIDSTHTYTLEVRIVFRRRCSTVPFTCLLPSQEFTTVQDNARDALRGIVDLFSSQCKEVLLSSCSASLKGFLEANGFGGNSFKTLQAMRTESARSGASDTPFDDDEEATKVGAV
jgi:hypothetical protein